MRGNCNETRKGVDEYTRAIPRMLERSALCGHLSACRKGSVRSIEQFRILASEREITIIRRLGKALSL